MRYVFFCYLFFALMLLMIKYGLNIMYHVQLSGYTYKSLLISFYRKFLKNYLQWFLIVVIMLSMLRWSKISETLVVGYLLIETLCLVFIDKGWLDIKLKFTSRMFRIGVVYLIFGLLLFSVIIHLNLWTTAILLPLSFVVCYLILALTMFLLTPVEVVICKSYLIRAKKLLKDNRRLIRVGITGSYGKTSTKEILGQILSSAKNVLITPNSYNTPNGVAMTINNDLNSTHEIFVCEMGAKKSGEIRFLSEFVDIDMGIVTSVGRQHTNTFGSIENVYKTKYEMCECLSGKLCVFNLMNRYTYQMYKEYSGKKVGVCLSKKHNYNNIKKIFLKKKCKIGKVVCKLKRFYEFPIVRVLSARNIVSSGVKSRFDICNNNQLMCSAETSLLGEHNILNILMAVAIANELGVEKNTIANSISKIGQITARHEIVDMGNGAIIINNGYNSNIDSAKYSFKLLKQFENRRKIVITPGLVECKNSYKYNYEFGKLIAKCATEVVVVKQINRKAIYEGLKSENFNIDMVKFADSFANVKEMLSGYDKDCVVLIENDLPDNYY